MLPLLPYLIRHTGASADFLKGRRQLNHIKQRGRWVNDLTMKKYDKHARSQAQLALLTPEQQDWVVRCHANLGEWLVRPRLAPSAPGR